MATSTRALLLNSCCLCIDLRTGSLVIGYLQLISNIVLIILGIVAMATVGVVAGNVNQDVLVIALVILAIPVVVETLLMGFIIALLVGIHQNKRGHVKAYLIFSVISIIISILLFMFAFFVGRPDVAFIVRTIINLALSIYYLLVIRSYYFKMAEAEAPTYDTATNKA